MSLYINITEPLFFTSFGMEPVQSSDSFHELIVSLFKKGRVKDKQIARFTDEESMKVFRQAFTHSSYSATDNYELLEFRGDTIVNDCVARYLLWRLPHIQNKAWLTGIKHKLISKKTFFLLAEGAGFLPHILYGEEIRQAMIDEPDLHNNEKYRNMLEDVFEAFNGAVAKVIDAKEPLGVSYAVSYYIVRSFLNSLDISTEYEDVRDSKSRFKEIFDRYKWAKFFKKSLICKEVTVVEKGRETIQNVCSAYGYPLGDKTPILANRVLLATGAPFKIKSEAEQAASKLALEVLKNKYGIEIPPTDPGALGK